MCNQNTQLQVVADWQCNWSAEKILRLVTSLPRIRGDEQCQRLCDRISSARPQDLFNVAAVLASKLPGAKDYFESEEMVNAKFNYSIGGDDLMYSPEEESDNNDDANKQQIIEGLIARYGRPDDDNLSVGFYINKIMDEQKIHGLKEAMDLYSGCDRYLRKAIVSGARSILIMLRDYSETIAAAFEGDFVRTYAMTALLDVLYIVDYYYARESVSKLKETLLTNIGIILSRKFP